MPSFSTTGAVIVAIGGGKNGIGLFPVLLCDGLVQRLAGGGGDTCLHEGDISINIGNRGKQAVDLGSVAFQNKLSKNKFDKKTYAPEKNFRLFFTSLML